MKGRLRQCHHGVGTTIRPDCTPQPIPPLLDQRDSTVFDSARTASHKGLDRRNAKPQTCAAEPALGCRDWRRWGTEGFLGLQTQPGASRREAVKP